MKPLAALVAIALTLLAGATLAGPAAAIPPEPDVGPLRLELTQVAPRVVTADGPGGLTVTGTLRNTGGETVDELQIRVQRGAPLGSEGELRDALGGAAPTDAVTPRFVDLAGGLAPGTEIPVQLTVPLRGPPTDGLALDRTGVHEVLVNVNGVRGDAPRARLAAVRFLLPVLGLPAGPAGAGSEEPEPPDVPTPVTVLYPIAAEPRRLPTVPGEPTLLTDDGLAASFAPGGRLDGLVSALAARAPVGSRTRAATCVAVDPDLVQTAAAMSQGYQVRARDGGFVPGTGAEAAGRWLAALAAATRGGCVLALPFADADLVALTRGGQAELARRAIVDGRSVLASALDTPVLPGTTWPAGGVLDEATLADVTAAEGQAVVLSADAVDRDVTPLDAGLLSVTGGGRPQLAVLTDPLLTDAATGPGATSTGAGPVSTTTSAAGTGGPLATQDLIGALTFRAREAAGSDAPDLAPVVVAPPHRWPAGRDGASELLAATARLLDEDLVVPRGLGGLVAVEPSADLPTDRLDYPLQAGGREIPPAVIGMVAASAASVADLRSAAVEGAAVGAAPDAVFDPLLLGTLRAASAAWRGRAEDARRTSEAAAGRIDELRSSVRVLEPPSPYSLGTSDAPLLLTVANGLPVTMRVRVELASTSGLRVAPIPAQDVPPLGRRQVEVSAQVTRSGQFTVLAAVRTPAGGLLGPPSRLQVRSTAYGTITLWLTGTAGVLLVVLAARRILRRVRGEPAPAAGPHPGPRPESRNSPARPPSAPPSPPPPGGAAAPRDPPAPPRHRPPPPDVPRRPRPHGTAPPPRGPAGGRQQAPGPEEPRPPQPPPGPRMPTRGR